MLVNNDATMSVSVHYRMMASGVRVETDSSKIPEKQRSKYKTVTFKLRPLTWKLSNELKHKSMRLDPVFGGEEVDWILYKENKLKAVMEDWDYVDESGVKVPITDDAIFRMHPTIAEALLSQYDKESYMNETERKDLILEVDRYVKSSTKGQKSSAPQELVEISLFEKFHWTPEDVDRIPMKRLQKIFVVMNQRDASSEEAMAMVASARSKRT